MSDDQNRGQGNGQLPNHHRPDGLNWGEPQEDEVHHAGGLPGAERPESDDRYIDIDARPSLEGSQEIVGVDPMLDEYIRAPFDPLYAARVGGRLTGDVISRPPRSGWLRPIAFIVVIALLAGSCGGLSEALGVSIAGRNAPLPFGLGLGIAVVCAVAGLALLWRLLQPRDDRAERTDYGDQEE